MMNALRWLALFLGSTLACQAWAYENLVGEYTGKLISVEGYSGNVGDPCAVMVGTSDRYGGSLTFEIPNFDKLLMETRNVEQALEQKSDTVKMMTPGSSAEKPVEVVVMKLGGDGNMRSLTLKRLWRQQHREKSVTCGYLSKK
jgi:hypothetical protein